jgi:hypothetical protein
MRYMRLESTAPCATLDGFIETGSGPKNRRVERREASVPRMRGLRELVCEGAQGRAISPCGPTSLAREGVAIHPERLSALRSLASCEGTRQASEVL